MNDKKIRYVTTIFELSKIKGAINLTTWNEDDFIDFCKDYEKHYGLNLISDKQEVLIVVEYTNIIWNYKIYYGSYTKKYKSLTEDDERWIKFETELETNLKTIGLEELKDEVLEYLKNKEYFEYKIKIDKQFKKYCV